MEPSGPLTEIQQDHVTIVVFGSALKQLDEMNVSEIGRKLVEIAERIPHPNLLLDMSATEFFGSSFIESLFRVWKKLRTNPSAQFGIVGLQPYCREVLEVTHLDRLWHLFETREAGLEAFNKASRTG